MKKSMSVLLAVTISIALLAGCSTTSQPQEPTADAPDTSAQQVKGDFVLATGGTSGTYYGFGGAVSQVLNKATGSNITANSTGGSVENIRLVSSGEADFGFASSDVFAYALDGTKNFKDTGKIPNVKAIASLYPELIHIVTTKEDIKSISDLKGKVVSVGAAGSGNEVNASVILAAYNLSYDDIDERFLSDAEASSALQDGTLDAAVYSTGVPNPGLVELSISKSIRILSIDDKVKEELIKKCPYYAPDTITKDAYNTTEEANTLASKALLVVREDMSEQDVYLITKALYENSADIAALHAKGKYITIESALGGIIPSSLHPGAIKYYKEAGVTIPE
jgi:hypothetical protein